MSDAINPFTSRSFRADRRLIAQLTNDPQLIRYLESLGVDTVVAIPEYLDKLLALIMDAAEIAAASQGTANNAARIAQDALAQAVDQSGGNGLPSGLLAIIELVEQQLAHLEPQAYRGLAAKVDDIEAMLLDFRPPIFPDIPAPTPPFAPALANVTAAYSVLAAPAYQPITVRADAAAGAFTVTLPAAPSLLQLVTVKKVDGSANVVTLDGGGILLDGSATIAVAVQYKTVQVQYNGSSWDVIIG